MLIYMKQILIEIDDRSARDLERVAPARKRMRAEFVRRAIRAALDRELDRRTEHAYREEPLSSGLDSGDLAGWDEDNALARRERRKKRERGN
jgi:Arc/MetJ-type ribon-helix-helix transcriptional regulator